VVLRKIQRNITKNRAKNLRRAKVKSELPRMGTYALANDCVWIYFYAKLIDTTRVIVQCPTRSYLSAKPSI